MASSAQITATEDMAYLTPIPQETLLAYRYETPITNKLQAVIVARINLAATRLHYATPLKVVSVEELKLEDAQKRVVQSASYSYEDRPGDTVVWLVIFEGEWQVLPPDPEHTFTPPPPSHGCVYVLLDANDSARSQVSGFDCAR